MSSGHVKGGRTLVAWSVVEATLSGIFRASLGGSEATGADDDEEARLRGILRRCRATWSDLEFDARVYVEALAKRVADHADPVTEAEARAVEDLYLGVACGTGAPGAVSAFARAHEPGLRAIHGRFSAGVSFDDFRQTLYEKLFTGERARIRSYAARGSLQAWVKIVATRLLSDLRVPAETDYDTVLVSTIMPPDDFANTLVKQQLRPAVKLAIQQSMQALSARQRVLLRERFIHGLSLAELARLHRVHRVTVSKQLAKARAAVRSTLQERLADTLGSDAGQIDSILRLCVSQLDVRFEELLRSR